MTDEPFVPFHRASIGQEEIDAVTEVLRSSWLTSGPKCSQLESEFAAYVGARQAIAVNSGTAALQLAIDACRLQPGDEVLVPTYTFSATAAVLAHFGVVPVLCDSVAGQFNLDPKAAEDRITERTRAIIPVDVGGLPCDLASMKSIAHRHALHLIEDAAHALPASYRFQKIGAVSEMTAFSFYATKTMTTGEGGMLTTDNDEYAARARRMRLHGMSGDAWRRYAREGAWFYDVLDAGYKLNLCDILAAIGLVQLRKCERLREQRKKIAEEYLRCFADLAELELPPSGDADVMNAWHLFILRIRPSLLTLTRDAFIEALKRRGIGTSVHFIPLHRHTFYREKYGYRQADFPHANDAYSRAISLPLFPDMDAGAVQRVVNAVRSVVFNCRKPVYATTA